MVKKTDTLAKKLIDQIYTTHTLKLVSDQLEELSQDTKFLNHADAIISDTTLTKSQKKTQLAYVIRRIEEPLLYDFFSDLIAQDQQWIFNQGTQGHFDSFAQSFQLATEDIIIMFLTTAVELTPKELKDVAVKMSETMGFHVIVNHKVNSALLAGIQVRLGNSVYDLSLRTKFRQFQRTWLATLDKTSEKVGRHSLD